MVDYKSSKATFVYEILMNRATDEEIIKGMMYWYFLQGRTICNLADDMHFRSNGFYKDEDIRNIRDKVQKVCAEFAGTEEQDESI